METEIGISLGCVGDDGGNAAVHEEVSGTTDDRNVPLIHQKGVDSDEANGAFICREV
ncbi:unnamed protein product [Citrullus colocynthis]|uniref:Uncharacterized protein n=1 Tax=Citrullus colocynthis TaxID=252529 RepID=A0ABP0YUT1_9ROSI